MGEPLRQQLTQVERLLVRWCHYEGGAEGEKLFEETMAYLDPDDTGWGLGIIQEGRERIRESEDRSGASEPLREGALLWRANELLDWSRDVLVTAKPPATALIEAIEDFQKGAALSSPPVDANKGLHPDDAPPNQLHRPNCRWYPSRPPGGRFFPENEYPRWVCGADCNARAALSNGSAQTEDANA